MRERIRDEDRERGFFLLFFFSLSIETWATRGVKWWTLNAPSLEKLAHTATISLCVSAPERQCEECKWAYTKPLDCLLKGRWGKGERVNGWYKLQKRTFERCWNVSFHMWRPRVHQSEFMWHATSPASLSLSPPPAVSFLPLSLKNHLEEQKVSNVWRCLTFQCEMFVQMSNTKMFHNLPHGNCSFVKLTRK